METQSKGFTNELKSSLSDLSPNRQCHLAKRVPAFPLQRRSLRDFPVSKKRSSRPRAVAADPRTKFSLPRELRPGLTSGSRIQDGFILVLFLSSIAALVNALLAANALVERWAELVHFVRVAVS